MVGNVLNRRVLLPACGAAMWLLFSHGAAAQQSVYPPLDRTNFAAVAPQGFGDRQNSWAWSMTWFNNKLYVGTNRAMDCVNKAAIKLVIPSAVYPPTDPDVSCAPDPNDLPLQAEIWSWDPTTKAWTRVFQSPNDLPIPNTSKFVARDIGFRGMTVYTESDGTKALYVGGCSSKIIHPTLPGGRLLRSTDGVNFTPVPQDQGTFMGNLGNTCFRGITAYNNKMYMLAGTFQGAGVVIESADPKSGNNSFQQVTPNSPQAYEMEAFNNYLYVTFVDANSGFTLAKTNATGPAPYQFTTVIPVGGYRNPYPNPLALSLKVFNNRLYVGGDGVQHNGKYSAQGAELFRVNPDDTWDLLVGSPRTTSPIGPIYPLSGLGVGFGWNLNDHMWRLETFDNRFYVGTFDDATTLRNASAKVAQFVAPELGFDLWYSIDGAYYFLIDQQGFEDKFNFGVRSLFATPSGLFLGSANWFYGLEIFLGIPFAPPPALPSITKTGGVSTFAAAGRVTTDAVSTRVSPPQRLQAEAGNNGILLAWDAVPQAKQYHVYRWTMVTNTEISTTPGDGPLTAPVLYEEIAATAKPFYADLRATPSGLYAYQVKAEDSAGNLSSASNYVRYPQVGAPMTFSQVLTYSQRKASAGSIGAATQQQFSTSLSQAQQSAQKGDYTRLQALAQQFQTGTVAGMKPYVVQDLEMLLNRLAKRANLAANGLLSASTL